ncbi:MAG: hypothetical protein ACYTGZ_03570 [Planctomycetota bacterium]|jgi:hypothetical protein
MSSVTFGCTACGKGMELEPGCSGACGACGAGNQVAAPAGEDIERCLACGCEELYRHRDFNQKLGLTMIAVGAVLWIWLETFIPMVVAAAIDLLLFYRLPDVGICYACKAHHRGFANIGRLPSFDLERHEHYRWVKHREETGSQTPES